MVDDPLVEVELDAAEIDGLLKNLGELRAMMQPRRPLDFKMDQDIKSIVDPRWECDSEPMLDNCMLHIRDPRYGWLRYVIPRDTAKKLGEALTSQAKLPSQPSST